MKFLTGIIIMITGRLFIVHDIEVSKQYHRILLSKTPVLLKESKMLT